MTGIEKAEDVFWERHSNPKSGWSRVLVLPLLLWAVYHRNWRLCGATIVFTVINPVVFSPPSDDTAWMTRVVHAERWWTSERNESVLSLSYPNILNVLNIPVTVYAFVAAYRGNPTHTILSGATAILLKFWYVGDLVRRYNAEKLE